MIYNIWTIDLGPAQTHLIADDMAVAGAPTHYPSLLKARLQDRAH